ncbi:hypothetical protein ILP97_23580 [Amycolatopsis sp. H6(2020)]|nr:hypothetical protein [Amycolatopsis sp. H6(2020)]
MGQIHYTVDASVEYDYDPSIGWVLDTTINVDRADGTLQGGFQTTITTACLTDPGCDPTQSIGDTPENASFFMSAGATFNGHYHQVATTMVNNEARILDGTLGNLVTFSSASKTVVNNDASYNDLAGRCDIRLGSSVRAGCINQMGWAFIVYDEKRYPAVKEVAAHVFDSIRNLPSHWGSPDGAQLNRTTEQTWIDRNRRVMCGTFPSGIDTCDEYPLASSRQGGTGAAPDNRSIRGVPKAANDSQGGQNTTYYNFYRILDGDPFYVQVYLADGRSAW